MTDTFSAGWQWNVPAPNVPRALPTMKEIFAEVCADHRLLPREVMGDRRILPYVRARQDFMWRCRQVRNADGTQRFSTPQIGLFLGGMDHTTVLHGERAHAKRLQAAQ